MTEKQPSREEATASAHKITVLKQLSRTIKEQKMFAKLKLKQLFPVTHETTVSEIKTNADLEKNGSNLPLNILKKLKKSC